MAIYSFFFRKWVCFVWFNAARAWLVYGTTFFFSTPTVSGLKSDHNFSQRLFSSDKARKWAIVVKLGKHTPSFYPKIQSIVMLRNDLRPSVFHSYFFLINFFFLFVFHPFLSFISSQSLLCTRHECYESHVSCVCLFVRFFWWIGLVKFGVD